MIVRDVNQELTPGDEKILIEAAKEKKTKKKHLELAE